jgi:hypothetical protein
MRDVCGMGALEKHIGSGAFAVGDKLSQANCTLDPALFLCEETVPMLDVENPILATEKVAAYRQQIQSNEFTARILEETAQGLKARRAGTEKKLIAAAIAKEDVVRT